MRANNEELFEAVTAYAQAMCPGDSDVTPDNPLTDALLATLDGLRTAHAHMPTPDFERLPCVRQARAALAATSARDDAVKELVETAVEWVLVQDLTSPPCTAEWLRSADAALRKAVAPFDPEKTPPLTHLLDSGAPIPPKGTPEHAAMMAEAREVLKHAYVPRDMEDR